MKIIVKELGIKAKSPLAMVLLLSLNTLFANSIEPDLVIQRYQEKSLLMYLSFPQERDFKITLKDADRVLLWKENQLAAKHFSKKINLVNLPDGTYFLEIEDPQMITSCQISIKDNHLMVEEQKRTKRYKPVITQKEEKVVLNMFSPTPTDVEITILDREQHSVYQEVFKGEQRIERSFDFSKAPGGSYTFQTNVDGRLFTQRIDL